MKRLKEKIKRNEFVFGMGTGIKDPAIVEMIAYAGYDFVFIDFEHSVFTMSMLEDMVRAAERHDTILFVRVPPESYATAFQIAEIGGNGVIFPHLSNKKQAEKLVKMTKYLPIGERGLGSYARFGKFGQADAVRLVIEQNENFMTTGLIENVNGLNNIDEILSVDGLDILHIGIGDLSISMGISGQYDHPDLQNAVEMIARKAEQAGVLVCMPTTDSFPLAKLKQLNIHIVQVGMDTPLITQAFRRQLNKLNR